MASFIIRRLIASIFVLFAATFLMYVLTSFAGDPLEELRQSSAPNKAELIEARTKLLNLDVPPPLRYFLWLGALFRGDFGVSVQNQPVNILLSNAITSTLTLVTTATVVAIVLGLTVGIVSALRQYSGFDYSVTLISFLFFSLPIFWVAVLLKQYGAIQLNNWLAEPTIAIPVMHPHVARGGLLVDVAAGREGETQAHRLRDLGGRDRRGAVLPLGDGVVRRPEHRHRRLLRLGDRHRVRRDGDLDRSAQPPGAVRLAGRGTDRHRAVLPDDQLHPQRHDAVVLPAAHGARRRGRAG